MTASMIQKRIVSFLFLFKHAILTETWNSLSKGDVVLIRHDNDCGYTYHGKAYAPLIDTIGDLCINHNLVIKTVATPFSHLTGKRAHQAPVSINRTTARLLLGKKVIQLLKGHKAGEEWFFHHQIHLWDQILEKISPRYVIGIQPDRYLCRAAKRKNIPVFDLQHGIIADEHPGYGQNYQCLQATEDLPDGYLCWDTQSTEVISKWARLKGIRVLTIGNPWFIRFIKNSTEDDLVTEAFSTSTLTRSNRPNILISLSWGMEDLYPDRSVNGVIPDVLEEVIHDTENSYNWILRLHPVQMRGSERSMVYEYLKKTFGIDKAKYWLETSEIPLPVVLGVTDLHITDLSTVVVEAAWMGIRSGILSEHMTKGGKYESYFMPERIRGMAEELDQDPDRIKKWIADTLSKGREKCFMEEYDQNLEMFITEIVRSGKR